MIREPEDLPGTEFGNFVDRGAKHKESEDKKGNPQIDIISVRGFFCGFFLERR
jgi:hypothetical protein